MKRTDAFGATVDNMFTDGDPSQGIPATRVEQTWLNNIQEELAKVVEVTGQTLNESDKEQVYKGILALINGGGEPVSFSINNNVTVPVSLPGLSFDKSIVKSVEVYIDIHRDSDTENRNEVGRLFLTHDPKDDIWLDPTLSTLRDDAEVTFAMNSSGELLYTTTDLGANHVGTLNVTDILITYH